MRTEGTGPVGTIEILALALADAAYPCQHSVTPIAALALLHYDEPMSFGETIFLFFLALIIFGPKKLPEIARQVGKYLNEFKRASNEFKAQIEQEIAHLDVQKPEILPPTLTSSSWAGDRHVTEGLAPEGTASRSLNSTNPTPDAPSANSETATEATLAAPLIEESTAHENPEVSASESAVAPTPAFDAATAPDPDPVKTPAAQESHA